MTKRPTKQKGTTNGDDRNHGSNGNPRRMQRGGNGKRRDDGGIATMTRDEMLEYARDRYDRARRESDELMRRMACGEIDRETWRAQDARIRGMREAYAGMIGALGEIL